MRAKHCSICWNTFNTKGHDARQINRNDVASLHSHNLAQCHLFFGQRGLQIHINIHQITSNGHGPTTILGAFFTLNPGFEQFSDRLQHRIWHGDMKVSPSTIHFNVKAAYHNHFSRPYNIGQCRVNLGIQVIKFHVHHRIPGFFQILISLIEKNLNNSTLCRGKFAPLNFCMKATISTKEIIYQNEDQLSFQCK